MKLKQNMLGSFTHHKLDGPNCVICKYQLLHEGEVERTMADLATPTIRPVVLTLLRAAL